MPWRGALSVLDQSPIPEGGSAAVALQNTLDLARHADALGLTRYWLAEHHNAAALACPAPEVMTAAVAAATTRIHVGAGGVMLPNHSPLKVAEVFRVLHALHPGRIDLGLGRAPGTDARTAALLRRHADVGPGSFGEQLDELARYLARDATPRAAWASDTVAIPAGVASPPLFVLGSSPDSARLAAERGAGYAYAHLLAPDEVALSLRAYRSAFQGPAPHAILAVAAVCAPSDDEAWALASSAALAFVRSSQGLRDLPLPSVAAAEAHVYTEDERGLLEIARSRGFVGSPDGVLDRLLPLCEESGADELMVLTAVHDHAARCTSYTLLAEALARRGGLVVSGAPSRGQPAACSNA